MQGHASMNHCHPSLFTVTFCCKGGALEPVRGQKAPVSSKLSGIVSCDVAAIRIRIRGFCSI